MTHVNRPWLRIVGDYAGPGLAGPNLAGPGRPRRVLRQRGPSPGSDDPTESERLQPSEGPEGEDTPASEMETGLDSQEESGSADQESDGPRRPAPPDLQAPPLEIPDEVERRLQQRQERQEHSHLNRQEAPQAFSLEGKYLRGLAFRFARMISKVAEDYADFPEQGDDEWDLEELRTRRFTGRLVNQCRMTRERRKVAIVLDTSPSCEQQARLFASVAQVAEALGDCELYDAPNFVIHARKLGKQWETLPEAEREWSFQRRVVLAFGDFDGIDRICEASQVRGNRIYWFCCEERAPVLQSLRETFLKGYKGFYLPVATLPQLMHAMRRVR